MIRAALALAALASPAMAAAQSCLSPAEAEAVALVAFPEVIRHTGTVCAARLPATSLLRRPQSAFLARYDAAAEAAWPAARGAIAKLADPAIAGLLGSDYARPLLTTLIAPIVVGRIAVEDCATVDRLVAGLEPLPPRNVAGLLVTAIRYLGAQKAKGKAIDLPDLPLCEARP